MKSKSKKAFEHNLKAEIREGKSQPQSLAIAYSVKRKTKKMAEGGNVSISAKSEKRPMPDQSHGDSDETRRNSGDKRPSQDSWTDKPTVAQAQKPSRTPLSEPRMVESSVIRTKMRKNEHDLMSTLPPSSPKDQPDRLYNELDADKEDGDPDMSKPRTTRSAYAKGGHVKGVNKPVNAPVLKGGMSVAGLQTRLATDLKGHVTEGESRASAKAEHRKTLEEMRSMSNPKLKGMAQGGMAEMEYGSEPEEDEVEHPAHLEEDDDQRTSAVDEYMADHFASGGMADSYDDGHEDSVAAAIMSRRDRLHQMIDSGSMDEDHNAMMAEGGDVVGSTDSMFDFVKSRKPSAQAIHSHGSMDSDDSDQADLSRNADEDANEEDQTSFDALRKENYSESESLAKLDNPIESGQHGDSREDDEENKHDMISSIRSKMRNKRQF